MIACWCALAPVSGRPFHQLPPRCLSGAEVLAVCCSPAHPPYPKGKRSFLGSRENALLLLSVLLNIWYLLAPGHLEVRAEVDAIRSSAAKVPEGALGDGSLVSIALAGLHSPRDHGTNGLFHPADI